MTDVTFTDDERALLLKLREWKDGIPDGALGRGKLSSIYLHLVAARAELYLMSLRHGHNDQMERRSAFASLVSPHDMIKLVRAWHDYQSLLRDHEEAEMWTDADDAPSEGEKEGT